MSHLPPLSNGRENAYPIVLSPYSQYPPMPHFSHFPQPYYYHPQPHFHPQYPQDYNDGFYPSWSPGGGEFHEHLHPPNRGMGMDPPRGAESGMGGGRERANSSTSRKHSPMIQQGSGGGGGGNQYEFEVKVSLVGRAWRNYDQLVATFYRIMMTKKRKTLEYLKYACSTVAVTTVLLCYAVGLIMNRPFTQNQVPFLSHTAVDYPEKIIFITGLTLSAIFFLPVLLVNQAGLIYVRSESWVARLLAHVGKPLGVMAAINLSLLAIFDVQRHESVHYLFALLFFCFAFSWAFSEAIAHAVWYQKEKGNYFLKRALIFKFSLVIILLSVLIVHFVVGFRGCGILNQYDSCNNEIMSAIVQYMMLGFVMLYIATLSFNKYENSILARDYDPYKVRVRSPGFAPAEAAEKGLASPPKPYTIELQPTTSSFPSTRNSGDGDGGGGFPVTDRPRKSIDGDRASVEMQVDNLPVIPNYPPPPPVPSNVPSKARGLFPTQPLVEDPPSEDPLSSEMTSRSHRSMRTVGTAASRSSRSTYTSDYDSAGQEESALIPERRKGATSSVGGNRRSNLTLASESSRGSIDVLGSRGSGDLLGLPESRRGSELSGPSAPPAFNPQHPSDYASRRKSSLDPALFHTRPF